MSAIIVNFVVIAVVVAGWTAAVWAFYASLGNSRALPRTARTHEVIEAAGAGALPATREDVRRAA